MIRDASDFKPVGILLPPTGLLFLFAVVHCMNSEKLTAIVIRLADFSETSKVVTMFSRELGKIGALAKGAKRLKGPFSGALDLLSVSRIVLIRKRSASLDLLTEADLEKRFVPPPRNLSVLYAGYFIAELLSCLTEEYDPHPFLFDRTVETLRRLEKGENVSLTVRRFEWMILFETGHAPQLDGCVRCGCEIETTESVGFNSLAGGLLCRDCCGSDPHQLSISPGILKTIQALADPESNRWERLQLDDSTNRTIKGMTWASILQLTGKQLRTMKVIGNV